MRDVGARLEAYVERLYLGGRARAYVAALLGVICFNAMLGVALGWLALYQYLDVTSSEALLGAILGLGGCALSLGIVFGRFAAPDAMRSIRWASERDAAEAEEAWSATTRLVHRDVAAGIAVFSLVFLPVSFVLVQIADLPWTSTLPFYAGIEIAILFSATLDYFAVELLLRPVRRDIARPTCRPTSSPSTTRCRCASA